MAAPFVRSAVMGRQAPRALNGSSAVSNGPLTQTTAVVAAAAKRVAAITNLPPAAVTVQATVASFSTAVQPKIADTQQHVAAFAMASEGDLVTAQHILSTNPGQLSPADAALVTTIITRVQGNAKTLSAMVAATDASVAAYYTAVTDGSRQLQSLQASLQGQRLNLQSQMDSANAEIASIKSKMKYYAILGIFGIAGLAVMTGLLVSAQNSAGNISAQIGPLQQQLDGINTSIAAVSQMTGNLPALTTNILSMRNSVDFVSSDIEIVVQDLNASNTAAALIYINTAIVELKTLAYDAS